MGDNICSWSFIQLFVNFIFVSVILFDRFISLRANAMAKLDLCTFDENVFEEKVGDQFLTTRRISLPMCLGSNALKGDCQQLIHRLLVNSWRTERLQMRYVWFTV